MFTLFRWLERLSLDAVIVAVLWALALEAGQGAVDGGTLVVLCLATWLTYVADRLRDAAPGRTVPLTERHLYYRDHYRQFRTAWLAAFPVAVLLAFLFLPLWKVLWGWVLVGVVLLYLYLLGRIRNPGSRLLLKRLAVPLIFTGGVAWMAESWRTPEGWCGTAVLLLGALANLFLISCQESGEEERPVWLPRSLGAAMILLVLAGNASLAIYWPAGAAALYCAAVYYVLFLRIKVREVEMIRMWADATLMDAAIILLILQIWV